MKKKLVALLVVSAMVGALAAGCGSKENDTKESEEKKSTIQDVKADAVEQRTVYVTPEWVMSALSGNQEGYEDIVVAEVGYGSEKD